MAEEGVEEDDEDCADHNQTRPEGVFDETVPVTVFLCFVGSPVNPWRKFWAKLLAGVDRCQGQVYVE